MPMDSIPAKTRRGKMSLSIVVTLAAQLISDWEESR